MKKILVAYDGGEPGQRALEATIQLARALDGKVAVISVVPLNPGRVPIDLWDDGEIHMAELVKAKDRLVEAGIDPELIEPYGDPAATIEHVAKEREFDVIVVAPRGLGAVGRLLEGSVSAHVAAHATTSVVIAR